MQTTDDDAPRVEHAGSAIVLRDMLARVSTEIDGAANSLQGFQDVLSLALSGTNDGIPSEKLQNLDLLHQTLQELAGVLAGLASMTTLSDSVDTGVVLDRCKLSDLAARLRGGTHQSASSDVDFF